MNNFYKEYEMLSAYIDGELSKEEVKYIEEKLAVSKDLQQKLAELKRIKELSESSFQKIPESPYFETRLISSLSSDAPTGFKYRKWIPVIGVSLATIVLMLFLKSNPKFFDSIIEEQKSRIAGLYTENLQPLFTTAGLTNEDIFDFAINRQLPLDKERGQYLMLGSNEDGSEYFEVKTAPKSESKSDFEKFVTALNLNEKQKMQMDSILDSYADGMQDQILINENSTIAISPKLWNYNKAIFADIMAFAKDANNEQFAKIVPAEFREIDKPQLVELAHGVRAAKDSDYIFLTPDTIFVETFKFNREKFNDDMKKLRVELKKNLQEVEKQQKQMQHDIVIKLDENLLKLKAKGGLDKNFEVYIDTNLCRVQIPDISFNVNDIPLPNLAELETQIEAATKQIKSFSFKIPKEGKDKEHFGFQIDVGDSSNKFDYKIHIPNLDLTVSPETFLGDSSLYNNEAYRIKADSMANAIKLMINDSMIINQKDFQMQMKEFKKEMRKLREELLKLQKNLNKEQKEVKSEESIEI
jgi:hypothetical protein